MSAEPQNPKNTTPSQSSAPAAASTLLSANSSSTVMKSIDSVESQIVNPAYENWIINDQLLMGWLYSSMTETIATEVMGVASAAGLWQALEQLYGAHSKSKMDETRTLIQVTRKGSTPMIENLRQKKNWADLLALAGEPHPESQLVTNVLSGLDVNYLTIVLQIEARSKTSWRELQELLLSFERAPTTTHNSTVVDTPVEVEEFEVVAEGGLVAELTTQTRFLLALE
uniref:Uncharacterized protein n=1 Tax=Cannabis sativa TaxID=3483 RepID=A0A803QD59_CANSA